MKEWGIYQLLIGNSEVKMEPLWPDVKLTDLLYFFMNGKTVFSVIEITETKYNPCAIFSMSIFSFRDPSFEKSF